MCALNERWRPGGFGATNVSNEKAGSTAGLISVTTADVCISCRRALAGAPQCERECQLLVDTYLRVLVEPTPAESPDELSEDRGRGVEVDLNVTHGLHHLDRRVVGSLSRAVHDDDLYPGEKQQEARFNCEKGVLLSVPTSISVEQGEDVTASRVPASEAWFKPPGRNRRAVFSQYTETKQSKYR